MGLEGKLNKYIKGSLNKERNYYIRRENHCLKLTKWIFVRSKVYLKNWMKESFWIIYVIFNKFIGVKLIKDSG